MSARWGVAGVVVGVALLLPSELLAAGEPPPAAATSHPSAAATPAAARARAQQLLDDGLQLVEQAEFSAALACFEQAQALYPSPKLLLNIGSTLRYLGRNAAASRVFEDYLAVRPAAPRRAEVQRLLDDLAGSTAWLRIEGGLAGAQLRIDGEPLPPGLSPLRWRVDPGRHVVSARKLGLPPALETVQLGAGEELAVRLRFEQVAGKTRLVFVPVRASPQPYIGMAMLSLGVVGVGLGSGFGLLASATNKEAEEHCLTPEVCDGVGATTGATAKRQALGSTVALALGGAGVVSGIIVWVTSPSDEPASVTVEPTVGGLRATARW